jgi:hypothetical protein
MGRKRASPRTASLLGRSIESFVLRVRLWPTVTGFCYSFPCHCGYLWYVIKAGNGFCDMDIVMILHCISQLASFFFFSLISHLPFICHPACIPHPSFISRLKTFLDVWSIRVREPSGAGRIPDKQETVQVGSKINTNEDDWTDEIQNTLCFVSRESKDDLWVLSCINILRYHHLTVHSIRTYLGTQIVCL